MKRLRQIRRCHRCQASFTLVEVLIVVVLMSILAAVVVTSLGSVDDAKFNAMRASEHGLAMAIEQYKIEHSNQTPALNAASLPQLLNATNGLGEIGTGAQYRYGPYVEAIPNNPLNGTAPLTTSCGNPHSDHVVASNIAVRWPPAECPVTCMRPGSAPNSCAWR